jgi:hypothetical protein
LFEGSNRIPKDIDVSARTVSGETHLADGESQQVAASSEEFNNNNNNNNNDKPWLKEKTCS